jgi:hypothetical protein
MGVKWGEPFTSSFMANHMGIFSFFQYGILFQAVAIIHFIRRRPENWWLLVILLGGCVGAIVYLAVEALPDLLDPRTRNFFGRRRRMAELQAVIRQNPSPGNYEELGDLYIDSGQWAEARACYDKSISTRTDTLDPFYRRGIAEMELGDFPAAIADLERVINQDPNYDFHRGIGLLAHAYAKTGQPEKARSRFEQASQRSVLSEIQVYYAEFLAEQGEKEAARQVAASVLERRSAMPRFRKRRDRPWFRRAKAVLRSV